LCLHVQVEHTLAIQQQDHAPVRSYRGSGKAPDRAEVGRQGLHYDVTLVDEPIGGQGGRAIPLAEHDGEWSLDTLLASRPPPEDPRGSRDGDQHFLVTDHLRATRILHANRWQRLADFRRGKSENLTVALEDQCRHDGEGQRELEREGRAASGGLQYFEGTTQPRNASADDVEPHPPSGDGARLRSRRKAGM